MRRGIQGRQVERTQGRKEILEVISIAPPRQWYLCEKLPVQMTCGGSGHKGQRKAPEK